MNNIYDYLILGAGPAGLQLGYFFEKSNRNYLILEAGNRPGNFFERYPRHRFLISINKVYTGQNNPEASLRWDWNSLLSDDDSLLFKNYSKEYFPHPDALLNHLRDFAQRFNLNIQYETNVKQISRNQGKFILMDTDGKKYQGKRLIIATGLSVPFVPDIPGIELCDLYGNHELDPAYYKNKRVLVIGKGNSGFETANHLTETAAAIHVLSPHSVKFAWQSHYVGNLRAVNNNFLDTYQLKSQNTVIDASVIEIEKKNGRYQVHIAYSHAKGQTTMVEYDHVIVCTGFRFDNSIFDQSCRPQMVYNDKLPAQTTEWESVNIPGMYFAGTLMQACDFKKTMSGFIHGFRHNVKALSHVLDQKYYGIPYPHETLSGDPEAVLKKVIERVNIASAMFLQPGFLGDVLVIDESKDEARYYSDVRLDYVPESFFRKNKHYYTISLEYGHFDGDPFNIERDPDPDRGEEASYLHPVIRRYNGNRLVAVHHVQDDLENNFYKEVYVDPARTFFFRQLTAEPRMEPVN